MAPADKIKRLLVELNESELTALGSIIRALVNLKRGSRELEAAKPKRAKRKAKGGK